MFNKNLFILAFFIGFLVFGTTLVPSPFVQSFKNFQSIFWQIASAVVLGFVFANGSNIKRKKFKIPHLKF